MKRSLFVTLCLFTLILVPSWGQDSPDELKQKAMAAAQQRQFETAIQWGRKYLEHAQDDWTQMGYIATWQNHLGRFDAAIDTINQAKGVFDKNPNQQGLSSILVVRAALFIKVGELDACKADLKTIADMNATSTVILRVEGDLRLAEGDYAGAVKKYEEALGTTNAQSPPGLVAGLYTVLADARRLSGDSAGAMKEYEKAEKLLPSAGMIAAVVHLLSRDGTERNVEKALEVLSRYPRTRGSQIWHYNMGLIDYFRGNIRNAVSHFASAHPDDPEEQYWVGVANLKAGSRETALQLLTRAALLSSDFRERIRQNDDCAAIRDEVLAAVGDLKDGTLEDRRAIKHQMETTEVSLGFIEGLIKMGDYAGAVRNLEQLRDSLKADSQKERIQARIDEVSGYASLFDELVDRISSGKLDDLSIELGKEEAEVVGATPERIEFKIGKSGKADGPWSMLSFDSLEKMLGRTGLKGEGWMELGRLCLEHGRADQAEKNFIRALDDDKGLAPKISQIVSDHRGIGVPDGGFVSYRGKLVTAEEKKMIKDGKVLFRGEWVDKKDKKHLEKNHVKVDGKWVALTPEQMTARGWVEFEGEWLTAAEYARARGDWEHAWEKESEHFIIRTNTTEAFADRLAVALEDAYDAYAKYFGVEPKGTKKMTAYAFGTWDDYKAYCDQLGQQDKYNALGFAPSEPYTMCGYDKFDNEQMFLETMVHETCHLYYRLAFSGTAMATPSWLDEGMATYFEGFDVGNGGKLTFDHINENRLATVKDAISNGKLLPLEELLVGDSGQLIASDVNAAVLFYAQVWGTYYFFNHTVDEKYRSAFREYEQNVRAGQPANLLDLLGPAKDTFMDDFKAFVSGL